MAEPIATEDFEAQIGAHSDHSDDDLPGAMPGDGGSDDDFDQYVASGEQGAPDAPSEAVERVGQMEEAEDIAQMVARRLRKGVVHP